MHNKIRIIKRMSIGIPNSDPEGKTNFGMTMTKIEMRQRAADNP
jgi:hypothetical protein